MRLLKVWKKLYQTHKAATLAATIGAALLVVSAVAIPATVFCIQGKANTQTLGDTQMPSEEETVLAELETEVETEISEEEYYEEELALDDSAENVTYVEAPPQVVEYPYFVRVNRMMNTVTIYAKDETGAYTVPVKAMVCSCGLNDGTPLGVFRTSTKYEWRALYGNVYGQYAYRINGPILFHSVPYFTVDKGNLETEEYNKLGDFGSLGCVRLAARDAKWLIDNCPSGTTVEIYDSPDPGPLGKPSPVRIDLNSPCKGWDPTDPDPANPWRTTGPTISGFDKTTVERGGVFDASQGITATAVTGDSLSVSTSGTVDVNVPGVYGVDYSAVDEFGNVTNIHVEYTVEDTTKPTITWLSDLSLTEGEFDSTQLEALLKNQVEVADGIYTAEAMVCPEDLELITMAIANKQSGTYEVKLYALDDAKNQSEEIVVKVIYNGMPAISTEQPQPEAPTESTEQQQPMEPTESTEQY